MNKTIKKHPSGNEYIRAGDVWVRNFVTEDISPLHITHMFDRQDYALVLRNEELNKNYPKISDEKIQFKNIVIVSDGYDFDRRHLFLNKLPKDVAILAVNKALRRWQLMNHKLLGNERRTINGFVVNNPYDECLNNLPSSYSKYYPTCLASLRTNYNFLKKYAGDIYTYTVTPEKFFGFEKKETYYIDDYRNPICAAIGFAYQFKAEKVLLLCCDDSFKDKRDFSIQLDNGLWTYPQLLKSQEIIDANLYWLTHHGKWEVKVRDYSSGKEYVEAAYISNEEEALEFFTNNEDIDVGK